MSRRMWILAVSGWVVVVIAGSVLTWLAIDRAGQQVTGTAAATQAPVVGTVGPPPVSSTAPSPAGPATAPASPSTSAPAATATPTTSPNPDHATTGPASEPTLGPTKRPATTNAPPPAPRAQTRTWSGAPGFVTVSCTGAQATRTGASPNNGWTLEAGDPSGDSVEVKFRSGEAEVQVQATCPAGVPAFQVETSGGAED